MKYLSIVEMAQECQVKYNRIYYLINTKKIKPVINHKAAKLFSVNQIDDVKKQLSN